MSQINNIRIHNQGVLEQIEMNKTKKELQEILKKNDINIFTNFISSLLYNIEISVFDNLQSLYKDVLYQNILLNINQQEIIPDIKKFFGEKKLEKSIKYLKSQLSEQNKKKFIEKIIKEFNTKPQIGEEILNDFIGYIKQHIFNNEVEVKRFILWFYLKANSAGQNVEKSAQYKIALSRIIKEEVNTKLLEYSFTTATLFINTKRVENSMLSL